MYNKEIVSENADDKDNNSSFVIGFSFYNSFGNAIGLNVGDNNSNKYTDRIHDWVCYRGLKLNCFAV